MADRPEQDQEETQARGGSSPSPPADAADPEAEAERSGVLGAIAAAGEEKPAGIEAGLVEGTFEAATVGAILVEAIRHYLENPPEGLSDDEHYAYGRQYMKRIFGMGTVVAGHISGVPVAREAAEAWFDKHFSSLQDLYWQWDERREQRATPPEREL